MAKRKQPLDPNAPLLHPDHPRPVTRRDFLRQGLVSGMGILVGGPLLGVLANPRLAHAALSSDLTTLATSIACELGGNGANPIPVICFDLAGGANIAGSNVLVGGPGGQKNDLLTTAGYSKLGLPPDMIPGATEVTPTATSDGSHRDPSLGLYFHSDSAFLRGIQAKFTDTGAQGFVNGAVIPARSDNDTGNNPHNPMYGIARAGDVRDPADPTALSGLGGANGAIVTLIGSQNSDSGGNSMAPASMIDLQYRPTKVDRPTDVTGMVDTSSLTSVLSKPSDVVAVMESVARISQKKLGKVTAYSATQADINLKNQMECGYLKAADLADRFAGVPMDPSQDPEIVNDTTGVFTTAEWNGSDGGEFRKTASIMKMVVNGYAAAGTVTMGGFDYHTGDRATGELRDLRAGKCMGACLQYAAKRQVPLLIYVFSDGSLASSGMVDSSTNGRGKGVWTGDNSSTAASFMLFYNPKAGGRPAVIRDQIGYFRGDGSVETSSSPAANNVNLLVETMLLNYLALQGREGEYPTLFGGLGPNYANYIAFPKIV